MIFVSYDRTLNVRERQRIKCFSIEDQYFQIPIAVCRAYFHLGPIVNDTTLTNDIICVY